jgi:hypothetical protein
VRAICSILAITIVIGLCGNTVNITVFGRNSMRTVSTFRFLLYLSVFDLLVLLLCATDVFAQFRYNFEIRNVSTFMCRAHTFLTYFLPQCSSNILMAVSIDRALVVTNYKSFYTLLRRRSRANSCAEAGTRGERNSTVSDILIEF